MTTGSSIPTALGNPGPPYRLVLTIPGGPKRLTDDGERERFHVATGGLRTGPRRRVPLASCRNILVVKLDFIGDWVLTTPFLANLRRSAPLARITVVVLDRTFELAATCRFVDRVISISHAERDWVWFGAANVAELAAFARDYAEGRFDLALVPRWDIDFNGALKVAWGSGAARVVGFSEHCTAPKSALDRGDDRFYSEAILDRRAVHDVEHNFALLEAVGGSVTAREASLDLTEADRQAANDFIAELAWGGRVLAVAPFAAGRRMYPIDRLKRLTDRLAREFDLAVAVIAGPTNVPEANAFAASLNSNAATTAGYLNLRESAAVIEQSVALIGMDSAPAHIAAAVGTPVAVLSCHPLDGSADHVNAPARFAPWGEPLRIRVFQPETATSPCRDGCEQDHPHCILGLDEATLVRQLRDFIGRFAATE